MGSSKPVQLLLNNDLVDELWLLFPLLMLGKGKKLFDKGKEQIYSSIYDYEYKGLVPGYQSIAQYHKDIDAVVILFTGPTYFVG